MTHDHLHTLIHSVWDILISVHPPSSRPHYSILRHLPHLSALIAIPPHNIPFLSHPETASHPQPPHPDSHSWFQPSLGASPLHTSLSTTGRTCHYRMFSLRMCRHLWFVRKGEGRWNWRKTESEWEYALYMLFPGGIRGASVLGINTFQLAGISGLFPPPHSTCIPPPLRHLFIFFSPSQQFLFLFSLFFSLSVTLFHST